MRISDLLSMSFLNLWRKKGRTFLTVLGVIIGSMSIILMVSIAMGSEQSIKAQLESMGNVREIIVSPKGGGGEDEYAMGGESSSSPKRRKRKKGEKVLDAKAIESFKKMENVEDVFPMLRASVVLKAGKLSGYVSMRVVDFSKAKERKLIPAKGRVPKKAEMGFLIKPSPYMLSDPKEKGPMSFDPKKNSTIDFLKQSYTVFVNNDVDTKGNRKRPLRMEATGLLPKDSSYEHTILVSREVYDRIMAFEARRYGDYRKYKRSQRNIEYRQLVVVSDKRENVEKISKKLKEQGYMVRDMMSMVNETRGITRMMTLVLGGIGMVSLFVAAIGIANTMIMAIYERTREIGVMKVLGANVTDILKMFLMEAGGIGLFGGLIGIGLSFIGSNVLNNVVKGGLMGGGGDAKLSVIPLWLAVVSVLFSTFIAVLFGLVPAIRATRLSALEAIKTNQ